ncbi:hypothetical protein QP572_02355 [Brevibacterium sp. UMB10442]|nr:hypothetical protein [Brevibacterium sp. UMB10442]
MTANLETIAAIIAAIGLIVLALRKTLLDLVTCLADLRQATWAAKREATKAKNITNQRSETTLEEVHKLTQSVTDLRDEIKDVAKLLHHRVIYVDKQFQDLDERLDQCANHQEP